MSDDFPDVPAEGEGLEEETAPPIEEAVQSSAVPIKRSLEDLSAAEEAQASPVVHFADKPEQPGKPAGMDTAPVSLDHVAQSTDSMRPASTSGSFDAIVNPSASGSYDQLNPASGSFDQIPVSSPYYRAPEAPKPKPKEVDDRPPMAVGKRLAITLVVAIVGFLLVTYLCIAQWVPPPTALALMGGGMVLPTLLVAFFTSQRSKKNIGIRMIPALLLAAGGMAGASAWSDPHVRALAVPYNPASIKGMKMMLSDPEHEIALAGCKRFTPKHSDSEWWPPMFELLNGRPKLAIECVSALEPAAKTKIGGTLADRWGGELVKGETKDPRRACAIAGGVATLPVPPQEAGARLLQCAVKASTPEIQTCCGDALASMVEDADDWAARLPSVVGIAKSAEVKSGVLAMSLHGQGLTEPQQKLAKDIGFDSASVRHVTLVLACESVTDESSVTVQHLKAALDAHCNLEMDRMPKGSQWAKVCRSGLERLKEDPKADPMAVLCELTTDKPISDAIARARTIVHKAPPIITK